MSDDGGMVRALPSAECPPGTPQEPALRLVSVGTSQLILTRLSGGEVVAFASRCPHQGTDLMDASFFDGRLRCPYHLYLYDPHTGENVVPAADARPENLWKLRPGYLPVHRVEEHDGWIWVAEAPSAPPPGWDPERERRPTVAEQQARRAAAARAAAQAGTGPAAAGDAGVEHPAKTVRVRPGATFEIRLPVAPRPGHVWRVVVADGPLRVLDERFDPNDPPRHRVRLSAPTEGVATVRCTFGRPWDTVAAETRTYVVRVAPDPA
ncbi:MAG: Rieske 2Fe-2S domain-containing protein [Acidimicrobiales bacterium]